MYTFKSLPEFQIEPSPKYGDELSKFIYQHNATIDSITGKVLTSAIFQLLIKKNLISEKEINDEMEIFLNTEPILSYVKHIENNRDSIIDIIEYEEEFRKDMESMHENLNNDVETQEYDEDINIPSIFED